MERVSDQLLQKSIEKLDSSAQADLGKVLALPLDNPRHLANGLRRVGSNRVMSALRENGGVSFLEVLDDVIEAVQAPARQFPRKGMLSCGLTLDEADVRAHLPEIDARTRRKLVDLVAASIVQREAALLEAFLGSAYEALDADAREKFDAAARAEAEKYGVPSALGIGGASAAMAAASAGGFATYMAMSSTIHALTLGAAGFSTYAAASSILGVVLGPAGWAALGLAAMFHIARPNKKRLIPAVAAIVIHDAQSEKFWKLYRLNSHHDA